MSDVGRGGLLGTAVAVACIPATLAVGISADQARRLFSNLALTGPELLARLVAMIWSASRTLLWGASASFVLLLLCAVLAVVASKGRTSAEPVAGRPMRAPWVLGLLLLPMLLAAVLARQESYVPRVAVLTLVEPLSDAERSAGQAEMETLVPGSTRRSAGAVFLVSDFVARRIMLVEAGTLLACGLFVAAGVAAAVLGRGLRSTSAFTGAGLALILLGLMGTAALARSAQRRMAHMRVLAAESPARWAAHEARIAAAKAKVRTDCSGGDAAACSQLASSAGDDPEELALLDQACTRGVIAACGSLGWVYVSRNESPEERAKAPALLKRACDGGHRESCTVLEHYGLDRK